MPTRMSQANYWVRTATLVEPRTTPASKKRTRSRLFAGSKVIASFAVAKIENVGALSVACIPINNCCSGETQFFGTDPVIAL